MKLKLMAVAAATVLATEVAEAADMPVYYEQPVQAEFGGWYLRGYGGVSKQVVDKFEPRVSGVPDTSVTVVEKDFEFAGLVGLGAGYDFGNGLRFDITAERRLSSSFDGRDTWNSGLGENNYVGKKDEWLFLANGYWEFYEAGNFKPFIGAGVGAVYLRLSDFGDIGPGPYAPPDPDAWGFAPSTSTWNVAGALYAGFGYQLSDNWTFDLNYRFLYLGDITSGLLSNPATVTPTIDGKFNDIMSHDVMFGLRYTFN